MNAGNTSGSIGQATPPPDLPDEFLPEWNTVRQHYDLTRHAMPQPDWMTKGYSDSPESAWHKLQLLAGDRSGAMSIYVHIPFCASRCAFCDCHSTLSTRPDDPETARYATQLIREVSVWSDYGHFASRPVTTVHFGGGTANYISAASFGAIVNGLRDTFNITTSTEFAVETTCRCLTPEHRSTLSALGFTRIHIGVQTLQPDGRRRMGRPTPPQKVKERIGECLDAGWIVSADLLYGLPGQTREHLLADVDTLVRSGIHGISLYRLNASEKNKAYIHRSGLDQADPRYQLKNYANFLSAAGYLRKAGFAKTHFAHFSRKQDRNLYARCASRGEDLLALGAYADGYFGPYYYRHKELSRYQAAENEKTPMLEGGGLFNLKTQEAQHLLIHLMANTLSKQTVLSDWQKSLTRTWQQKGILTGPNADGIWDLTDSGSWVISQCLHEITMDVTT